MNDESLVSGDAPRDLAQLFGQLAEAVRRHRVFVSITVSSHEPDVTDEAD